ncbi:ankyrin repeat-containing domain protein [Halenospora varia]|nr:ankyrin repeat-containing domain protein [Halenospora varia]
MAIKAGHAAVVKVLVENGVDLEQKSRYGETALSMAIKAGHIAIVKVLLENGASIHGESSKVYGVSPLYMAVTHKQIEMVKLLIENSSIAEHISRDPDALIHAVKLNQKEIVELLLKCGTNPDQRVKGGYTPLESHVVWNYKIDNDVVRLLVEAGAKVTRFAWESFTLELREQYADRCPI